MNHWYAGHVRIPRSQYIQDHSNGLANSQVFPPSERPEYRGKAARSVLLNSVAVCSGPISLGRDVGILFFLKVSIHNVLTVEKVGD